MEKSARSRHFIIEQLGGCLMSDAASSWPKELRDRAIAFINEQVQDRADTGLGKEGWPRLVGDTAFSWWRRVKQKYGVPDVVDAE